MAYLRGFAIVAKIAKDSGTPSAQMAEDNSTLSLTANTEDVSTKDDVGSDGVLYPCNEMTYISASLSVSGKLKTEADVLTIGVGDTVKVSFAAGPKGKVYTFNGIVSSRNFNADKGSSATYDYTVDSSGKITIGASA